MKTVFFILGILCFHFNCDIVTTEVENKIKIPGDTSQTLEQSKGQHLCSSHLLNSILELKNDKEASNLVEKDQKIGEIQAFKMKHYCVMKPGSCCTDKNAFHLQKRIDYIMNKLAEFQTLSRISFDILKGLPMQMFEKMMSIEDSGRDSCMARTSEVDLNANLKYVMKYRATIYKSAISLKDQIKTMIRKTFCLLCNGFTLTESKVKNKPQYSYEVTLDPSSAKQMLLLGENFTKFEIFMNHFTNLVSLASCGFPIIPVPLPLHDHVSLLKLQSKSSQLKRCLETKKSASDFKENDECFSFMANGEFIWQLEGLVSSFQTFYAFIRVLSVRLEFDPDVGEFNESQELFESPEIYFPVPDQSYENWTFGINVSENGFNLASSVGQFVKNSQNFTAMILVIIAIFLFL